MTRRNPWIATGLPMFFGLFVAYLDRSALSTGLPELSRSLHFSGASFAVISSLLLTLFNAGYGVANVIGGFAANRMNPKWVVTAAMALWCIADILTGLSTTVTLVIIFRVLLGIAEGVYWPQQSRIAVAWFSRDQLSRANSVIQFYGQFLSLGIGFLILASLNGALGWRWMFLLVGLAGIVVVLPMFLFLLHGSPDEIMAGATRAERRALARTRAGQRAAERQAAREAAKNRERISLASFGGPRFVLVIIAYFTQGMVFWGITLWIPLAVSALGFGGNLAGFLSGVPYLCGIAFAIPLTIISDRTGKRVPIASGGLLASGIALLLLLAVHGSVGQIVLISIAVGVLYGSFSPNIWSIIQATVTPDAVGPASGIVNGIGAGLGGVVAGWLVGLLLAATRSYTPGFILLGAAAVIGSASLIAYGRRVARTHGRAPGQTPDSGLPQASPSDAGV
jgi:sugar phosphate permease